MSVKRGTDVSPRSWIPHLAQVRSLSLLRVTDQTGHPTVQGTIQMCTKRASSPGKLQSEHVKVEEVVITAEELRCKRAA